MKLCLYLIVIFLWMIFSKLNTVIRYLDLLCSRLTSGTDFEGAYRKIHMRFFLSRKQRKRLKRLEKEEELLKKNEV